MVTDPVGGDDSVEERILPTSPVNSLHAVVIGIPSRFSTFRHLGEDLVHVGSASKAWSELGGRSAAVDVRDQCVMGGCPSAFEESDEGAPEGSIGGSDTSFDREEGKGVMTSSKTASESRAEVVWVAGWWVRGFVVTSTCLKFVRGQCHGKSHSVSLYLHYSQSDRL